MPSRISHLAALLLFAGTLPAAQPVLIIGDDPGSWNKILGSVGVAATHAGVPPAALPAQVEAGAIVIIEGASEHAEQFGIRATPKRVSTRSVVDEHNPKLPIIWQRMLDIPVFELPSEARVFSRERWTGAPLVAGMRRGSGAVLWLAARPGSDGYERFPYVIQALGNLGLQLPLESKRLWAFFDSSYRARVDLDYFAEIWRRAGISALHVAAWHYNEPDPERDAYLKRLIKACHKRSILVYAWLELPHVSEAFWRDHPEWREKTALLQDAHLDWRKLMNLSNRDCFRAVSASVGSLLHRFDWDGVNLAELYFESLEGAANPARFTPMNDDVRAEYKALTGVDPIELVKAGTKPEQLAPFLRYRAEAARRMQREWMSVIDSVRTKRPHLELVLTHVDDRFDTRMRDLIGADAAGVLPMLNEREFTFLIEDPATIWHLGPSRYPQIAERYKPLTKRADKLAIDINIVERYQDVYPTKQQTGTELFQLVRLAAEAFPRVALYFENSILKPDIELLPAAGAVASKFERIGDKIIVDSPRGIGVRWTGRARVNGRSWPVTDDQVVWLPAGPHVIEPGSEKPALRLIDFNGELSSATSTPEGLEFAYKSSARALAKFSARPAKIEVDGQPVKPEWLADGVLALPRGQHVITVSTPQRQFVAKQ